jgi:methylsterol monooxygenase
MSFVYISLAVSFFSILVGGIYSYIVLYTDWLKPLSIQTRRHKPGHFWERFPLIALNIALMFLISGTGLYFGQGLFDHTAPSSWWIVPVQVMAMMVLDDLYFYFYHSALHRFPFLYKKIHRIHHQATQPFPLEFIYVHPLEWMLGSLGIVLGLAAVSLFSPVNALSFWIYVAFRNLHEVDIHSGTRSLLAQYIPFYGTVEHHDFHHSKVTANYASTFTIWDKLFGTYDHAEEKN